MAGSEGDEFLSEGESQKRPRTKPYSAKNPIPNIKRYHERQEERRQDEKSQADGLAESDTPLDGEAVNRNVYSGGTGEKQQDREQQQQQQQEATDRQQTSSSQGEGNSSNGQSERQLEKTEVAAGNSNSKSKGKTSKKSDPVGNRTITDPVTHLPSIIHDFTKDELEGAPHSLEPEDDADQVDGSRPEEALIKERDDIQAGDRATRNLFPPPSFEHLQKDLSASYGTAVRYGLAINVLLAVLLLGGGYVLAPKYDQSSRINIGVIQGILFVLYIVLGAASTYVVSGWMTKKAGGIWENHVWQASAEEEFQERKLAPESTMWLNHFLAGVWPLINPDLFTSIADTLEDVMQASLPPKLIRMVAVADIGQGAVSPRILGARWLPSGAATESVSTDGKKQNSDSKNDRQDSQNEQSEKSNQEDTEQNVAEGLEAESGDFVNLELVLSYRPVHEYDSKDKARNAHLFLDFYLPGGIPAPVFVSLRGLICRVRLRMQLTPDPPFINLLTMTLMGQPKVDISCVPITKKLISLTDIPLISSFVSSSVDAAFSEYVSPRSLTLNMKQMLSGDDFKKNTETKGVVVVEVKRGYDFKEADTGIIGLSDASTDAYVSVGWAKFGKPLWSTRVILKDMHPVWEETAFIPVGTEEINADESLRVQLWDSDRMSADDDLGRIEVPLKELTSKWRGKMFDRCDGFISMDADEKMPGKLEWRVGYFQKLEITKDQLAAQDVEPNIRSIQELRDSVAKNVSKKLRETDRDMSQEVEQQRAQDFEERSDALISAAPPPQGYDSGILSVQVHNITGLSLTALRKSRDSEGDDYSENEYKEENLPSSYAMIILNNKAIYKTRTKPKNSKPFFNAGTERFVRDWKNAEVVVAVRDARSSEEDPLLGFVYLPLEHIFKKRSQTNETYPLSGGTGHGRVRISMVFRSTEVKLPKELCGWDVGTLEIAGHVTSTDLSSELQGVSLVAKTRHGKGKLHSVSEQEWAGRKDRTIWLAVTSRYSSHVVFKFRTKDRLVGKSTAAFAILWLKDLPDDEAQTVELAVFHGKENMKRALANCVQDFEERSGTIKVPLRFWPGLSDYHSGLAKQNPDLAQVMELNEAAGDQQEKSNSVPEDSQNSSSSSSDESDGEDGLEKDGKRGPLADIKEYQKHHKILHRQHRGVMQWKAARTNNWMLNKAQRGFQKVTQNPFQHHDREPGIETEV